jgi:hypothetical protein
MDQYRYRMVRVVCQGKIKTCKFCEGLDYEKHSYEGYCTQCGRPLYKKPGDECNFIVGYVDRLYKQQNKVHFKCKFCQTITTV